MYRKNIFFTCGICTEKKCVFGGVPWAHGLRKGPALRPFKKKLNYVSKVQNTHKNPSNPIKKKHHRSPSQLHLQPVPQGKKSVATTATRRDTKPSHAQRSRSCNVWRIDARNTAFAQMGGFFCTYFCGFDKSAGGEGGKETSRTDTLFARNKTTSPPPYISSLYGCHEMDVGLRGWGSPGAPVMYQGALSREGFVFQVNVHIKLLGRKCEAGRGGCIPSSTAANLAAAAPTMLAVPCCLHQGLHRFGFKSVVALPGQSRLLLCLTPEEVDLVAEAVLCGCQPVVGLVRLLQGLFSHG